MSEYKRLEKYLNTDKKGYKPYDRIVCKDGASVSIQMGEGLYCSPRTSHAPWYAVEAGYPSCIPPISWKEYVDGEWSLNLGKRIRRWWYGIMFSANADYTYGKGNKIIGFIKGMIRGIMRDSRALFMPQQCNTVYGYIPVELVKEFIDIHGGEK